MQPDNELRATRRALAQSFDALDGAATVLEFQEELARHIRAGEALETDAGKAHVALLRAYGDALAHRLLDSHSLRQLAKNSASHPPSIRSQGEAFSNTMAWARALERDGAIVLIADLTNIVKIGDLIICNDPDLPDIVECKAKLPRPQHLLQGRRGRQFTRAFSTIKYLKENRQTKPDGLLSCVIASGDLEYVWPKVQETLDVVGSQGFAASHTEPGAALLGYARWTRPEMIDVSVFAGTMTSMICAFHHELLGGAALYPPPMGWPLRFETRLALMERDLTLARFADMNQLLESFNRAGLPLATRPNGDESAMFDVVDPSPMDTLSISNRPITDVVFGYQTIESTASYYARVVHDVRKDAAGKMEEQLRSPDQELGIGIVPSDVQRKGTHGAMIIVTGDTKKPE